MKQVFLIMIFAILISESGNCQWYCRRYCVSNINQLSQEQLGEALDWTKENIVGWSILTVLGTAGIAGLIIDANNALPGDLSVAYNVLAIGALIPVVITSLVLIHVNTSRVREIRGVLKNSELSFGLTNYLSIRTINYSNIPTVPNISLTIYF